MSASSRVVSILRLFTIPLATLRARGSPPKALIICSNRDWGQWFTTSYAVNSLSGSNLISSSASNRKLNPRSGVSSWAEDTPRSNNTPAQF